MTAGNQSAEIVSLQHSLKETVGGQA